MIVADANEVYLPAGLMLFRSVVELESGHSDHRIMVEVHNMSNRDIVIPSKAPLCHVRQVISLHDAQQATDDEADLEFLV